MGFWAAIFGGRGQGNDIQRAEDDAVVHSQQHRGEFPVNLSETEVRGIGRNAAKGHVSEPRRKQSFW